jgi:plastocyanin
MRRFVAAAAVAASILGVSACSNYGNASPTNPSGPSSPPADALTISIVAINGSMSFSPNPASVPAGQIVVWHNVDGVTHRVVLNDGSVDTGNLEPGAFSSPMTLGSVGAYHCTIHPVMVGTLARQALLSTANARE